MTAELIECQFFSQLYITYYVISIYLFCSSDFCWQLYLSYVIIDVTKKNVEKAKHTRYQLLPSILFIIICILYFSGTPCNRFENHVQKICCIMEKVQ